MEKKLPLFLSLMVKLVKEGVMDYVCICASCWKPNCSLLALGRLVLSMTQTGCWEAQPGNEAFGKVAGARRPSRGLIKDLPARAKPFLPTKAVQVVTSWPIARGDTQSRADFVRSAHPARDQANSVTADIRHSDC